MSIEEGVSKESTAIAKTAGHVRLGDEKGHLLGQFNGGQGSVALLAVAEIVGRLLGPLQMHHVVAANVGNPALQTGPVLAEGS